MGVRRGGERKAMINEKFLTELFRRWHGYAPPTADAAGLVRILAPMDAAAEAAAAELGFDDAPADYAGQVARLRDRADGT